MVKKIVIGFAALIVLLVGAVIAVPFLFKDKINATLKEEINKQVNAKVDYGDFSLSLLRSFPNFNFSLNDLSVIGMNEFKGDTLLYVKNFAFTIDLMSVIKGEKYKLLALNVKEPYVHAVVNPEGKTNWDIMKDSGEKKLHDDEAGNFSLEIKKYKIEKGMIVYEDKQENSSALLNGFNFEGSGNVANDLYDFLIKSDIAELTYKSGVVPYLNKVHLNANVQLAVDNQKSKYTFRENLITLNDLGLQFDGFVELKEKETVMDLKFKSKKTEFKSLLSLIPAIYKKDFDKVKTSGSLALEGSAKGSYLDENYPALNLKLNVNNGMFQYPDLPVPVKNIFIASNIVKPQGSLDLITIDISKLHLEAGTDPIDGKVFIKTPMSNPDVAANITGKVNLSNVPKLYPMEGLKSISGLMNLNLDFKGKKSDLDNKNYEAIRAAGNLKIANLVYDSKETPMPVRIPDMQMTFNPRNITLNSFSAVLGKSDFNATGTLDNFMAYSFGKGDLSGTITLRSANFDANEWLQKDKTAGSSTNAATTQYFQVPKNIDFTANSSFGKILYEKLVLENVKGQVVIKDETIYLNDLFANLLGGNATISAQYKTKNMSHPEVTFNYDVKNFDIQKTYQNVGMSGKMAPVMKHIEGNFSSNLKGSGKLDQNMDVDYQSLNGEGTVEIPYAKITGMPALSEISKIGKIPALQNLELKNAVTSLKFNDGKVNVKPTDLKFGNGYNMHLEGTNGFDQSINYDMRLDVPTKELGQAGAVAQNYLSQIPGLKASLPETLGFLFKITGTMAKPQVKLTKMLSGGKSTGDMVKDAAGDLKKQAEEQVKQKADELKAKAEDELQKQKVEAERKAKEAIDKAKNDALGKAKKEAEEKAKKLFKIPR
ncbi:MAG: hypothetical protein IPP77_02175 [Bacteroidetes bacterium]|nr:hypothetical protein [Bacteroidota bacterium]